MCVHLTKAYWTTFQVFQLTALPACTPCLALQCSSVKLELQTLLKPFRGLQRVLEKAVVLGIGVNKQSASEGLSGAHLQGSTGWVPAALPLRTAPGWSQPTKLCAIMILKHVPTSPLRLFGLPRYSAPHAYHPLAPVAPLAADLIVRYAEILASNGRLGTALDYLSLLPGALRALRLYSFALLVCFHVDMCSCAGAPDGAWMQPELLLRPDSNSCIPLSLANHLMEQH
jgi:hypothetical protein